MNQKVFFFIIIFIIVLVYNDTSEEYCQDNPSAFSYTTVVYNMSLCGYPLYAKYSRYSYY